MSTIQTDIKNERHDLTNGFAANHCVLYLSAPKN